MKGLSATVLTVALAAAGASASAQAQYRDGYYPSNPNNGYANDGYPNNGYPNNGYANAGQYDYARVLRVQRVAANARDYGQQGQRCYRTAAGSVDRYGNPQQPGGYYGQDGRYYPNDGYAQRDGYYGGDGYGRSGGSETGRQVATVLGGVVGAVLGSQVGGGSARYATSAIGSMMGGMAGRQIYEQSSRQRQTGVVTTCDPVPVDGYRGGGYGDAYDVTYEYNGRQYTSRMNYDPGQRVRVRVDVQPQ